MTSEKELIFKIPKKILKLPEREREILDKLLFDDGKLVTKRGLIKERHRPLSVKQIAFIMHVLGYPISSKTLYEYLKAIQ